MSRRDRHLSTIFLVPAVVGGLALAGLGGALLGDGLWDWLGCALIAPMVAVVAWARIAARRASK